MGYLEEIANLRKKFSDVVEKGLMESKEVFESLLINIMNESERQRQICVNQASELRKQASMLDGQANGFASMSSIVNTILNGFLMAAERANQAEIENSKLEEEKLSNLKSFETIDPEEPEVKSVKKRVKK